MTNVEKLIIALVGPAQDIENCLQQLLLNRAVSTATGVQLDLLGRIVGQLRLGQNDDDYRRFIRARIATNRSGGVTEDLLTIMGLIVNSVSASYHVERSGVATVVARIDGIAVDDSLGDIVFGFLKSAKSGGVRLVVQWSESLPENTFRFDSGPGFNQGHLASARSS